MDISIDFGITVTDIIKRDNDVILHEMTLSKEEPSLSLLKQLLPDIDFKSDELLNFVNLIKNRNK